MIICSFLEHAINKKYHFSLTNHFFTYLQLTDHPAMDCFSKVYIPDLAKNNIIQTWLEDINFVYFIVWIKIIISVLLSNQMQNLFLHNYFLLCGFCLFIQINFFIDNTYKLVKCRVAPIFSHVWVIRIIRILNIIRIITIATIGIHRN